MGTLSIAMESNETIPTVSFDDLFVDDIESPSDTEVKEINDILEQAIELSSTVPCFNPLKDNNFSSSLQGGTDADNGDMGKRRLRSDSGKNADADLLSQPMTDGDADLLSQPMTEGGTEQMCAPNCRRQQIGRSEVHTFDDEENLRKQKQPDLQ